MPSSSCRVLVNAPTSAIWTCLSDPERFLAIFASIPGIPSPPGSNVSLAVGEELRVVFPNRMVAKGRIIAADRPSRLTFTWGYDPDLAQTGIKPGSTTVDLIIAGGPTPTDQSSVVLTHSGHMSEAAAASHTPGWAHALAQLALQSAMHHTQAALPKALDAYFAAWSETNEPKRLDLLKRCCAPNVQFRTSMACTDSIDDLNAHITSAQAHMPDVTINQAGPATHVHGVARVRWAAYAAKRPVMAGENIMTLNPPGMFQSIIGFTDGLGRS